MNFQNTVYWHLKNQESEERWLLCPLPLSFGQVMNPRRDFLLSHEACHRTLICKVPSLCHSSYHIHTVLQTCRTEGLSSCQNEEMGAGDEAHGYIACRKAWGLGFGFLEIPWPWMQQQISLTSALNKRSSRDRRISAYNHQA